MKMTSETPISNIPKWKTVSEFSDHPPPRREWLVQGWMPIGQPTLLYGDGGTGKSLLALQLCASVALNFPWLELGVKHGRSIYFTAEDDEAELHRRLEKICISLDVRISELSNMEVASMIGMEALFVSHDAAKNLLRPTKLLEHIQEKIQDEKPALVVFDTLADIFAGDENQRSLSRQFISMMRTLAYENDFAVLILAHPSKTGMHEKSGTSGSTGWSNSARSRIYLSRPDADNPNIRKLENMKNNYAQIGNSLQLEWYDGCFISNSSFSQHEHSNFAKIDEVFVRVLDDLSMKGINVNANSGPNYAPTRFAAHSLADGITKNAFRNAMRRLLEARTIESVPMKHGSFIKRIL